MHYVTQSEIKKMLDYEAGACGLKIESELSSDGAPSAAMRLGIYFEFLVSGGLPRSKEVPEPERTAKGELTAPYKVATSQAERVKTYLKRMGVTYEAQTWRDNDALGIGGHLDLVAQSRGLGECVIDLKYSGLVDNRWEKHGWTWTDYQTAYHAIQARHYHLITGLPFYYLVTESREGGAVRLFGVQFGAGVLAEHMELVERTREFLVEMKLGLSPAPEVTQCEACALYATCNHRAIYPEVKFINV